METTLLLGQMYSLNAHLKETFFLFLHTVNLGNLPSSGELNLEWFNFCAINDRIQLDFLHLRSVMANKRKQIGIIFLLLGALLSTQGMQYVHLLGEHQEESQCTENTLHIHEGETECAFHFLYTEPFVDLGFYLFASHLADSQLHHFSHYTPSESSSSVALPALRGPPIIF